MNTHLLERLECIQDSLMAHYRGGTGLPNAVAGNEREVFVKEFLQKVFPSHYRFTSGVITDADDRISGQMDLVVEYPFLPSFPMPAGHERVILAESVVAAIELKSDLSAQWGQLTEEAYKLKHLTRDLRPIFTLDTGATVTLGSDPLSSAIPYIAVGYRGYKTIEGLRMRIESTPEDGRPDAALVIESGCFYGLVGEACGAPGLYMLCECLTWLARRILVDNPDTGAYMRSNDSTI